MISRLTSKQVDQMKIKSVDYSGIKKYRKDNINCCNTVIFLELCIPVIMKNMELMKGKLQKCKNQEEKNHVIKEYLEAIAVYDEISKITNILKSCSWEIDLSEYFIDVYINHTNLRKVREKYDRGNIWTSKTYNGGSKQRDKKALIKYLDNIIWEEELKFPYIQNFIKKGDY